MANRETQIPESTIRDALAEDLSVLEPGLSLIEREHRLFNPDGAGGRIDILAKDEFKNYVIIEIKKSNQSARQALHEIFKYASILKHDLGIKPSKLRVILVSTDWHELQLPFSTYVEREICHTTGYKVTVDHTGHIMSAEKVNPRSLPEPIQFSRTQLIYLYENAEARDLAIQVVYECWNKIGMLDHVLVRCDYDGQDDDIIYKFAIYMLIAPPTLSKFAELSHSTSQYSDDEWEAVEDRVWQMFGRLRIPYDDVEAGGPDMLAKMLELGWELEIARRSGRFAKNIKIVTDNDLLDSVTTFDGASQSWLCTQVTPRFADQWAEFRCNLDAILAGNGLWSDVIPLLLDEIAQNDPEAKISISVYNLADTARMLHGLADKNASYCPLLEIVSAETNGVRLVMSRPVWNGRTLTLDAVTFFTVAYGSAEHYRALRYAGDVFRFDDRARERAEITTPVLERFQPTSGDVVVRSLSGNGDHLLRSPLPHANDLRGLSDYVAENTHFFRTWRYQVPQMNIL